MNSEAISGIKKAAALCGSIREKVLTDLEAGKDFESIRAELHNPPETELILVNDKDNSTVNSNNIYSISLSCCEKEWTANCGFSFYSGDNTEYQKLVETNRLAVINTGNELCPGFKKSDIIKILDLYKENFTFTSAEYPDNSRLKAGDIITIEARYSFSELNNQQSISAFHKESVLITANGSVILTRM
ncbi:MAG: hypothetical protein NE327_20000 [Lentisphaeraceae bacterium]|nr:hypothetical protein [Lentisphaeraceae bacterium]